MSKKLEMPRKAEKQFKELSKYFKITRREFLEYYNAVRKANRKLSSKRYKQKAMLPKKYSYNMWFKTREQFKKHKKNVMKVLEKDFLLTENQKTRKRIYASLRKVLGYNNARKVIEKLDKLTDDQLRDFFNNNEDIKPLMYYDADEILEFVDITTSDLISRL